MMSQRNPYERSDFIDKIEQLKTDNFHLKRELAGFKTENHKLKVKVRKLQEDLNKRQKQIYNLVDPKKSSAFRKFISEHGASMFLNLKEQKEQLIKNLLDKDNQVKKLQHELQMTKLYLTNDKKKVLADDRYKPVFDSERDDICRKESSFKSSSLSELKKFKTRATSALFQDAHTTSKKEEVEDEEETEDNDLVQLNFNLQKIKINSMAKIAGKDSGQQSLQVRSGYSTPIQRVHSPYASREPSPTTIVRHTNHVVTRTASPRIRQNDSPQSDMERIEVGCETPHEEIQQLQSYFMEMLDEVGTLKNTIQKLQTDQRKTSDVLKDKEEYIEELAEEIQTLKTQSSMMTSKTEDSKISLQKKKKVKKQPAYDRRSTGSIIPYSYSSYKHNLHESRDDLQRIKDYLFRGRMKNQETDVQSDIDTVVQKKYKIIRRPSSKYSQDSELLFIENYGPERDSPF